jgi:hypothetical protein
MWDTPTITWQQYTSSGYVQLNGPRTLLSQLMSLIPLTQRIIVCLLGPWRSGFVGRAEATNPALFGTDPGQKLSRANSADAVT